MGKVLSDRVSCLVLIRKLERCFDFEILAMPGRKAYRAKGSRDSKDSGTPILWARSGSKYSFFEAKFATQLAKHLVLNGIEKGRITLLTPYLGQKRHVGCNVSMDCPIFKEAKILCSCES